jgi:hypothetical protein
MMTLLLTPRDATVVGHHVGGAGGVGAATGFQERLRAHLHCATTQAGGSAGSGNPRYFPTEACAAAAAAMVLSRQLGNIQVLFRLSCCHLVDHFSSCTIACNACVSAGTPLCAHH